MQLRELLLGIEGLALLRGMNDGDDKTVEARIDEVRWLADAGNTAVDERIPVRELDVEALYRAWADTYDDASRPIRPIEEPVVWSLLEQAAPGRALDAACGTGRHARKLVELGHRVTGVDLSPEMLAKAKEQSPEVDWRTGDLADLPLESGSFDLVVCGLALDHCPSLLEPVAELARVTRPGGRVIVSDINPLMSILGGAAHVKLDQGVRGFARNHSHLHNDFLTAFQEAGLEVRRLHEPRYEAGHLALKRTAMSLVPDATLAAYLGLPAVVVWDLRRL
ncbi:class I SAM-dependent methyltransferase [Microbispora sp. CA-135349]|uniref:class I SAM-dependent methyltransferase n=1 Tax=Microbispora sp. CA-135349 TaxID=3239953 RepID=UPI003D8FBF17